MPTTRLILQDLGEIKVSQEHQLFTALDFELDSQEVIVSRGRAHVAGRLINPRFSNLVENLTVEVLASAA
ncbi:MAG TPA: hypothetical protein VF177_02615 [Anaerolineae bacterium]